MTDYGLDRLVESGNSVVVIEHNLDVIKNADWLIDLGSEGGDRGGEIVAEGPLKEIAKSKRPYTRQVLKEAGMYARRLSILRARATRGLRRPSLDARSEGYLSHPTGRNEYYGNPLHIHPFHTA